MPQRPAYHWYSYRHHLLFSKDSKGEDAQLSLVGSIAHSAPDVNREGRMTSPARSQSMSIASPKE